MIKYVFAFELWGLYNVGSRVFFREITRIATVDEKRAIKYDYVTREESNTLELLIRMQTM